MKKFETKFETGDIVQHVFDKGDQKSQTFFAIMEIHIQKCYTTTQVFYLCRPIILVHDGSTFNPGNATAHTAHGTMDKNDGGLGWKKLREDELMVADKRVLNFLKKVPPVADTMITAMENTLNPPKEKK